VEIASPDTIADGLRTTKPGVHTFPIVQSLVEDVLLVTDDEIREALAESSISSGGASSGLSIPRNAQTAAAARSPRRPRPSQSAIVLATERVCTAGSKRGGGWVSTRDMMASLNRRLLQQGTRSLV